MRKIVLWLSLFVVVLLCIVSSKKLAEIEKREALINEANDCLATGDWKCAEKNVRELLKAEPNDSNLQMHMAGIFFEQERYKECVQYIDYLLQVTPF